MKNKRTDTSSKTITGSTYVLLIFLDKAHRLLIGKLGWNHFEQGFYIYIGSAKKLIKHRLARHLLRKKKRYWHIDFVLSDPCPSVILNIWIHREACECSASRKLFRNGFCNIVKKGFGSSDCQCIYHFFKIDECHFNRLDHVLAEMGFSSLTDLHSLQFPHEALPEVREKVVS